MSTWRSLATVIRPMAMIAELSGLSMVPVITVAIIGQLKVAADEGSWFFAVAIHVRRPTPEHQAPAHRPRIAVGRGRAVTIGRSRLEGPGFSGPRRRSLAGA